MFFCFQIALLVVTGPQDMHQPQYTPLADAAGELENAGVEVFALSIGPSVVPSELEAIASRPENIFSANAVSSLPILASQLTDMMRQGRRFHCNCSIVQSALNEC